MAERVGDAVSATAVIHEPSTAGSERQEGRHWPAEPHNDIGGLLVRVRAEYTEIPGLRLTQRQAARLFSLPVDVTEIVLTALHRAAVLTRSADGAYLLRR
jgi:hypothetical protein